MVPFMSIIVAASKHTKIPLCFALLLFIVIIKLAILRKENENQKRGPMIQALVQMRHRVIVVNL